ncbi:MAG: peptide deformylase [Oscillospiraceae bacterium]|jgi:peptide deformylase|nr:peptide deformylase [Oscillospiraceae bacterium]
MAIRNIIKDGDEILHKKSRPVEQFDEKLGQLLDDMRDTMKDAEGAGLAAVQVGILRRVCVIDVGDGVIELVNPQIVEISGEEEDLEGCLSFPGVWGLVTRPETVKVMAKNRHGNNIMVKGTGLKARALCHEIDHMNGVVFKSFISRFLNEKEVERYNRRKKKGGK